MRLIFPEGKTIDSPSPESIRRAVDNLDRGRDDFVALEAEQGPFVQVFHDEEGYLLEFHDGERHQQVKGRPAKEEVARALHRFARGEASWEDDFRWRSFAQAGKAGNYWWPLAVAILVAIAMILLGV